MSAKIITSKKGVYYVQEAVICFLMIAIILTCMPRTVWADSPITFGEIDFSDSTNPYDYAFPPDGIFPFLYDGTTPFPKLGIDTSGCEVGRLYVYDEDNGFVREVIDETVILYTETNDYLFFMTSDKVLYMTPYLEATLTTLYQSQAEEVEDLDSYGQLLYFVEDDHLIRFLDVATGLLDTEAIKEDISTVTMLTNTELLINTVADEYLVYDRVSDTVTETLNESQAVSRMNQAAMEWLVDGSAPDASILSVYTGTSATQKNNIAFPLSEYPANIPDNSQISNFDYYQPISWFHENGQEGCSSSNCKYYGGTYECEGFARYAHDAYLHILDPGTGVASIDYPRWLDTKHSASEEFDGSNITVKSFFEDLSTGAYIRYTKQNDITPSDGAHSIVFLSEDGYGVWVYEANQKYDDVGTDLHGCGVQVRYYTYSIIAEKYTGVLHYINHRFTEGKVYYNSSYHKVGCPDCTGYVMQDHSGTYNYTYVNASTHTRSHACCGGGNNTGGHTVSSVYRDIDNETYHQVYFSCCKGGYQQQHTFNYMNMCTVCGYIKELTDEDE